jgi:putative transposase
MSIRRPDYLPGHYYHLYNRGAHRDSIFREEDNYLYLLRKVKAYCCSLSLTPIAYTLLPNHYHFLIRQDGEEPTGRLPQRVFNSYTKAYNRRYGHSGTLFEGNYRAVVVDEGILVDRDFVRAHFPATDSYRAFVGVYLAERRLPEALTAYLREWEE